jgi:8-oxo-dGTP pyrophosphatase MutT (NUDIX family)
MPHRLSLDDVGAHLAARLRAGLPGAEAQRRFAPQPPLTNWSPDQTPDAARRAAVLVLVYPGRNGPALPLTLRPTGLPAHAGQISLPGGALAAGESPEAAALREAEEEVGVEPSSVRVVGRLSTLWVPVSNFVVTPIIGISAELPAFRLHEAEVAALIEAPVARLLDRTTIHWARSRRDNQPMAYPYFDVGGHAVWGATAMILAEFSCLFAPDHTPGPAPV